MDSNALEIVKKENIETLNQILEAYRGAERKSKIILEIILVIWAAALYFVLFDLLGGLWGFVLTIAVIAIGVLCVEKLGITFNNAPMSDAKLAYRASVAMWILIEIEKGTYRTDIANVIGVSSGNHVALYKNFIKLYPEFASKSLEKLAKIETTYKDM
ncbi:MAG: hypothetical protein IJW49_03595 [Clostridia bacterium]|nr:hypothetical protein [Clostridia bacterium]